MIKIWGNEKNIGKCEKYRENEENINIYKSNLSQNIQFPWPRGPILWETASYM